MDVKEFKMLEISEKLALVNNRLAELKEQGVTTKQFRNDHIKMSYDYARDQLKALGYVFNRDAYAFIAAGETVQPEEEVTKMELTNEEYKVLKEILAERKAKKDTNSFEDVVKGFVDQELKATSVKLRKGVASDWTDYSKDWGFYNSSDLVSAALVHFMQSFPATKKATE